MKKNTLKSLQAAILGGTLLLACASAQALSITFDENGTITGDTANWFPYQGAGNPGPISLGLVADGLGGQTLSYATETPNGMHVSGDVLIYEDAAHTILSDILRFYASGQQYISVYSDRSESPYDLADVGFSAALLRNLQANQLALTETALPGGGDGLVYLPTDGQPGFGGNITYTFISDTTSDQTVPDGGTTVALLGMGLAGLASLRKWLARA